MMKVSPGAKSAPRLMVRVRPSSDREQGEVAAAVLLGMVKMLLHCVWVGAVTTAAVVVS